MRIENIQALRACAALSVATVHVLHEAIALDPDGTVASWHGALPWEAGVDLFFIISGFIMVHASQRLFGQPGAPWQFLGHRLARVVPLYWAATALFLAVAALAGGTVNSEVSGLPQVLASFAFILWPRPGGVVQPVYSLGWTLNYEMLFYAIFALWIRLPQPLALGMVLVALLALAGAHPWVPPGQPQLAFWTDPVTAEFALGMGVAVIAQSGAALAGRWRLGLAAAAAGLLVWLHRAAPEAAAPLRAGVPMALLLAAAALGPSGAWGPLVLVGDASYALYLVHPFPMRALAMVWRHWHCTGLAAASAYCLASLAASVLAAVLIHVRVKRPATRAVRRWLFAPRLAKKA